MFIPSLPTTSGRITLSNTYIPSPCCGSHCTRCNGSSRSLYQSSCGSRRRHTCGVNPAKPFKPCVNHTKVPICALRCAYVGTGGFEGAEVVALTETGSICCFVADGSSRGNAKLLSIDQVRACGCTGRKCRRNQGDLLSEGCGKKEGGESDCGDGEELHGWIITTIA